MNIKLIFSLLVIFYSSSSKCQRVTIGKSVFKAYTCSLGTGSFDSTFFSYDDAFFYEKILGEVKYSIDSVVRKPNDTEMATWFYCKIMDTTKVIFVLEDKKSLGDQQTLWKAFFANDINIVRILFFIKPN